MKILFKLVMASIFLSSFSYKSSAQIGSIIKKTKDKVNNTVSGTASGTSGSVNQSTDDRQPTRNTGGKFILPDFNSGLYRSGSSSYSVSELQNKGYTFWPHTNIRKEDESGSFHFAMHYPELKKLIVQNKYSTTMSFSSAPFNNPSVAKNFSSSKDHIYARLSVSGGTIGDVFDLKGDVNEIKVTYIVYSDGDELKSESTYAGIFITKEMATKNILDFDIMPSINDFTIIRKPDGGLMDFYNSRFPYMHNQSTFSKNGNYKVGILLKSTAKDDWGNATDKSIEVFGWFDYIFSAADAQRIENDGKLVFERSKKNAANNPLPAEWSKKSNAINSGYSAQQIQNALNAQWNNELTIYKLYANNGSGWVVNKNSVGIPLSKSSSQVYTIFAKRKSTNECFYQEVYVVNYYSGAGTYLKDLRIGMYDPVYINCDKMGQ